MSAWPRECSSWKDSDRLPARTGAAGGGGRALARAPAGAPCRVLHALLAREDGQPSLARLVHHAAQAEDAALVLRFAPEAARQAAAQGAHREAVAHYQTALRYADQLDGRAARLNCSTGCHTNTTLTGQIEEALAPCEAALALWRALDRTEQVGHALRRCRRMSWFLGRNARQSTTWSEAVALLETLPPGRELAMAYAQPVDLAHAWRATRPALVWGERAIALAERLGDAGDSCAPRSTPWGLLRYAAATRGPGQTGAQPADGAGAWL